MKTENAAPRRFVTRFNSLILVGVFIILAAVVAVPFYTVRSSSSPALDSRRDLNERSVIKPDRILSARNSSGIGFPLLMPLAGPSIATFDDTCAIAKTQFNLGQTACATATSTAGTAARRISWVDPSGFIRQVTVITSDPQNDLFSIPATPTSTLSNGQVVNNVGNWRVNILSSRNSPMATALFEVKDPANATADLSVTKIAPSNSQQVAAGANGNFNIAIQNGGPDDAATVTVVDHVPDNVTFVSMGQTSALPNPGFTCTNVPDGFGNITCSIATLAAGATATFNFNYTVNAGTPNGTLLVNTVSIASATNELNNSDNSATATAGVASGNGTGGCTLDCPNDITITANTTEGGQPGAHVTYPDATGTGTCGSITSAPVSGSFFPVGTTSVTATSATGGGECTFTITVEEAGNTNITCPANIAVNADANCGATVTLGTPTATGTNVTIVGSRSDGVAMYNCDTNGENCVRKGTDLPFAAGVTVVTWSAYSHDIAGPYANNTDEEVHRTGNASCQQTVTVNDVTPPTITAPDTSASADASCQAPVPNYATLATVSDNCSCASSDTSQICDSRRDITITQSPAAGTLVGLGPHTITLTANDGSSNNGGAGNTATINVTFTVNDTTAPTINCPANITIEDNVPGSCGASVNIGTATASDNCDTPSVTGVRSDGQALIALYPVGTTTITWTARDGSNNTSSCTQTVTVTNPAPTVTITGPVTPQAVNTSVNFTATFTDNAGDTHTAVWTFDGSPQAGTVNESLHTITTTHTFTTVGYHAVTLTVTDDCGQTATANTSVLIYAFATATGSFVIGDGNAAVGTNVTFWGAQWASLNSLSGGSAPSSFKGFASNASSTPPHCGGTWTTGPGNSSNPPDSIPAYLGVFVSSSITKSGSTISGNIPKMVVVHTNPGYASNPGHAGTGTVVAVICQ